MDTIKTNNNETQRLTNKPAAPRKHGKKLWKAIAIAVVACLLIGGAILAFRYYNSEPTLLDAAESGNVVAQYNLGLKYALEHDYDNAVKWLTKSADLGFDNAQLLLAQWYYNGTNVPQDSHQGMVWYKKAADRGNTTALYELADIYFSKHDLANAMECYQLAAMRGHAKAQFMLGASYHLGWGGKQDFEAAVEWFTKAAEQDHAEAQCGLGFMYENGQGVTKDKAKAIEWYKKAASQGQKEAIDALKRLGVNM